MSKILSIADIHIHDYPQRNPSEKFRLYQTRQVAQNIIEVGRREGAEILVIAGDILEKSIIRPYVQAEAKMFLDTVMSAFKEGYIIWGNHDQDNKGSEQEFTDSCLSVMLPPNLYYADKKEVYIDNSRIAFSNWRPGETINLDWIVGCVDVLFTHATICYSGTDLFKSQVLDESKFNLAICGDIHKPGQIGKYVSIGIPQRCKMSDGEELTGVIYDCETKNWKWVNMDPHGALMKFQYTPNKDEEGWDNMNTTWKIFKPENLGISNSAIRNIKVPAWQEVENLIDNIIIGNGLQDVHGEVLRNLQDISSKEVDFDFQLTRFYCKNWRSIDEVELFFDANDKILITGANGAGKSSLLSALRFAFEENRFIKDFIQIGTKDCVTEVDFLYQGNLYRIQRGSKTYGFWINGEPQKYNNKKLFEEDMHQRFPFIDYMDVYFFDSDHHKLIGDITPERKSEIISKFFKLDKIDAYNEQAEVLLDILSKNTWKWKDEISKAQEVLGFIENKLNVIQLPTLTKLELEKSKAEGIELQRKERLWTDWCIYSSQLDIKLESSQALIDNLQNEINNSDSVEKFNSIISELQNHRDKLSTELGSLGNIEIRYNSAKTELEKVNLEGNKLYTEWSNLGKTKNCPCCGQVIQNTEALEKHRIELESKLSELTTKQQELYQLLESLVGEKNNEAATRSKLQTEINECNSKISDTMMRKNILEKKMKDLVEEKRNLSNLIAEKASRQAPEQITLPKDFMERMAEIESGIVTWNTFESLLQDRRNAEFTIQSCQEELNKLGIMTSDLQKYIKLTGPTGKIYEEIMTKLAEQFSDNQVKYEVITYNFRKKDHLDLASSYKNSTGNWIAYQACSSGQKTVLDVNFLSKIVTRLGLLIMDEFLKHLDPANHEVCVDLISSMNIGCTMISSHMESIAAFNNKSCKLELNDSGVTKIILE